MDLSGAYMKKEILCDILTRLPVKSLVRFMCVSKPWHHLISDPSFVNSHVQFMKSCCPHSHAVLGLTHPRGYSGQIFEEELEYLKLANSDNLHQTLEHVKIQCPWRTKLRHLALNQEEYVNKVVKAAPKHDGDVSIAGHCNGIICASHVQIFSVHEANSRDYHILEVEKLIICNPITRRFKILPDSDIHIHDLPVSEDHYSLFSSSSLYKKLKVVGFGFVDDLAYKVVRVTYAYDFREYKPAWFEVYDSRSESWRRVLEDCDISFRGLYGDRNNFLDGCLYRLGTRRREDKFSTTLVSFNIVEKTLSEILLPCNHNSRYSYNYSCTDDLSNCDEYGVCNGVAILGESVALLVGDKRNRLVHSVWKMKKEEEEVSWKKMYRLNSCGSPIGFSRDGELVLRIQIVTGPENWRKLILYDLKKAEQNASYGLDLGFKVSNVVTDFVESLLLLDGEICNPKEEEEEETNGYGDETPDAPEETAKEDEEATFELGGLFDEKKCIW